MSYTFDEVKAAVDAVEKAKGFDLSVETACLMAGKIDERLQSNMPFLEARRYSLNEVMQGIRYGSKERKREMRSAYNSVMGKVFGSHGGRSRKKKAAAQKPPASKKAPAKKPKEGTLIIEEGKKGQLKFLI